MAEEILLEQFPEVIHVVSKIGSAEVPTDPMAIEDADIMITMKPKKEWTSAKTREEMSEKMKEALAVIPAASFDFTQPIQLRFNELMTGVKTDVAVKIFGEDLDELFVLANEAAGYIETIPGAGDVKVDQIVGLPQLVVRFDREKLARYGLNIEEVNDVIRTAFAGQEAGLVFEGERRFSLVVRLDEAYRKNVEALQNLRVNRPDGELILLNQVADIEEVSGPMLITREETKRRATIGINVRNRDVESFIEAVDEVLQANLKLPPGYYITYGGQFENLITAKRTSAIAVPVAMAAIFIMLFFAFGSVKQSVMIFTAIPLATVGGIWALVIRGMPFSISAGVGFIALFGIAVLNGIVLISHYNQLEKEGVSDIWERIKQGTSDRLRPVIMTSLVAALGFIPMALSTAAGAEVQKPLATVVIGGILTASVLTLVVLPVLYYTFNEGMHCGIQRMFPKRKISKEHMTTIILLFFALMPAVLLAQTGSDPGITSVTLTSAQANNQPQSLTSAQANNQPQTLTSAKANRILSMQEAVELAKKYSFTLKNLQLEDKAVKSQIMSAFNLEGPSVLWQTGQLNSANWDYNLSITQGFDFPMVYVEQVAAAKARHRMTQYLGQVTTRQLIADVQSVYMDWWATAAMLDLKKKQDSLLTIFYDALKYQYQSGEVNQMMVLLGESKKARIASEVGQLQLNLLSRAHTLSALMGVDTLYQPPAGKPAMLPLPQLADFTLEGHPATKYLESNFTMERASLRRAWWNLAPSFSIGYFTQSLDKVAPFTGWEYGISLPIWLWGPIGEIKSANHRKKMAENERMKGLLELKNKFAKQNLDLQQAIGNIQYFNETGNPLAESMIQKARRSYDLGEISLVESILMLQEAFSIQVDYIETLNAYNHSVIRLNAMRYE